MAERESYPHCEIRRSTRKPIENAVEEIARRLGIVPKDAWTTLREALSAGDVKAYWLPSPDPADNPLAADRWPRAQIELAKAVVILADKTRMAFVELDRVDFETWLDTVRAPRSAEDVAGQSEGGHLAKLARAAAEAIWPDGIPEHMPPQTVFKRVADRVQHQQQVTISKSTVLRALGMK